ncbi:MAG TPA: type II toxin-antitoxin system Phd/YefM family antitoxin, partial [Acidimicrobiales bacterium]|nr:type II toxin-antitoxin system Phd/YefM family antitoxin [Acidimicrobiales bacterium]
NRRRTSAFNTQQAYDKAITLAMTDTLPLATIKDRFSEIMDRVNREHNRVVVTRNGIPTAVLMSLEEIESLDEMLAYMSDSTDMDAIRESIKDAEERRVEVLTENDARARWNVH